MPIQILKKVKKFNRRGLSRRQETKFKVFG